MKTIIIIGSGIGGLVAGNLLAGKGHKVTIFEAHSMPGGYTAGFIRKGYYFESGTLSLEATSSVFKVMREIGVLDQVDFVKIKTRFVSEEFDGIPQDFGAYKNMVHAAFPSEKEKLDMAFSELDKMIEPMGITDAPMPFVCSGIKKVKSVLPAIPKSLRLIKLVRQYGDMTSSAFAERYFEKGSKLYSLFSGFSYPDLPAIATGAALSAMFDDIWTVRGGMQLWADVLAENFKKLGGELNLKSYVDKIITKNGTAAGVSCKNTDYHADYVISAGDYKKTFLRLLDDKKIIPPAMQEKIAGAATSESFFTVYLGLNMPDEKLAEYMKVPHICVCEKKADCDIHNSEDGDFFSKTSATVYSPSMVNPKHAPEGKSSLMLQTMVPFRWMNNWGGGDRDAYKQLKEKAMEAMIDRASAIVPDLRSYIDYRDAATPLTYERFTHNTDGASSAWSWNPKNKFYKSGLSIHIKTPVRNLYIGSCWGMQIGGIPGALGASYLCAKKIK